MRRVILGYIPANVIPALVSIAGIYMFTRLLSTQAFGTYNLAFSVVMVAQSLLFFAPNLAITRFYAAAEQGAGIDGFLKTTYVLFLAIAAAAVLIGFGTIFVLDHTGVGHGLGDSAALLVPLLLLRALVATNQTINRAAGRMARFNVIECLQAVLGLAVGLALVIAGYRTGAAVMAGLIAGAAASAAIDVRLAFGPRGRATIDRELLRQTLGFCWPLVLAFAVSCSLQYADRFLVNAYGGASALGIYVVAFSLVDRPITLICMSITAGTFPMAVEAFVRDGPEAGRIQAGRNGAVLLALTLPACLGLMLTSKSVAAVLVGPSYHDGVALLIPIMAATALLRGVGAHYVDHAFHLANRSFRLFAVYAPSAIGNILLSALLVPRHGMIAAAYGALACQTVAIIAGWLAARRVLPLWLPARDMVRIAICLAVMAATLTAVTLPVGWIGLVGGVALGLASYGGCAIALDLGGLRRFPSRHRRVAAAPDNPPTVPACQT
jgi:O-antigen/teichoic acid export membrane protein